MQFDNFEGQFDITESSLKASLSVTPVTFIGNKRLALITPRNNVFLTYTEEIRKDNIVRTNSGS